METSYMIWINEFIVEEENVRYDFLKMMYPEIKGLYNIKKRIYDKGPMDDRKRELNAIIGEEIEEELSRYNIPEYVLLTQRNGIVVEPISGKILTIPSDVLYLRKNENQEIIDNYIENLTISKKEFLEKEIPIFLNRVNKKKKQKNKRGKTYGNVKTI